MKRSVLFTFIFLSTLDFKQTTPQILIQKLAELKPAWTLTPQPSPPSPSPPTTELCTQSKLKFYNMTRNVLIKFCMVASLFDLLGYDDGKVETCCQVDKYVLENICYDQCAENQNAFDAHVILVDLWRTVCKLPKRFCKQTQSNNQTKISMNNDYYTNNYDQNIDINEEQYMNSYNDNYETVKANNLILQNQQQQQQQLQYSFQRQNYSLYPNFSPPFFTPPPPSPSLPTAIFVHDFILSKILDQIPGLSIFKYYVQIMNLYQYLENPDFELTLFFPTNEAFAILSKQMGIALGDLEKIPGWYDVITYHVVQGPYFVSDVLNGTFKSVDTVQGNSIMLKAPKIAIGCCVTGNSAEILVPDMEVVNGVFHVINTVLLPFKLKEN